jgi:alkylhydroperoxidase family enzyme
MSEPFAATVAAMGPLQPVDRGDIADPELVEAMERSDRTGLPGSWLIRLFARQPESARLMIPMLDTLNRGDALSSRLKEMVRSLLAGMVDDAYYAGPRSREAIEEGVTPELLEAARTDYEDDPRLTARERLALRFAEQLFLDSTKIGDAFYADLKAEFTEPEIMELGTFASITYGLCVVTASLGATPDLDER